MDKNKELIKLDVQLLEQFNEDEMMVVKGGLIIPIIIIIITNDQCLCINNCPQQGNCKCPVNAQ